MTSEHNSLEKYTSHTLFKMVAKGLRKGCVWEVSWRLNKLQHIDPQLLCLKQHLSRSTGLLNRGSWGLSPLWELALSTSSYLQLTDSKLSEPVCGPGLYNCLTSTCFLWASLLDSIQPVHSQGYTLISSTRCTYSLIDGWVGGQYVTCIY